MNIDTWAVVLATFFGPVAAVEAQRWVAKYASARGRKLAIFRTLMATRATVLAPDAVNAFNAIPIEFYGHEDVMRPWRVYFDHLDTRGMDAAVWADKRWDLHTALLFAMAQHLGYEMEELEIKKKVYAPEAHGKAMSDSQAMQDALRALLTGNAALPIQLRTDSDALQRMNAIQLALLDWLTGKIAPKVDVERRE